MLKCTVVGFFWPIGNKQFALVEWQLVTNSIAIYNPYMFVYNMYDMYGMPLEFPLFDSTGYEQDSV